MLVLTAVVYDVGTAVDYGPSASTYVGRYDIRRPLYQATRKEL